MAFRNIGKALAILRRERGLSQAGLAEWCEIGRSQVSRYEAGKELMKLETLEKILARLTVEPDDFFRFLRSLDESAVPDRQRAPEQTDDRRLADAFQNMHGAIDELRQAVERSIEPATRFTKLIDEAAGASRRSTGGADPLPAELSVARAPTPKAVSPESGR
jgi:transcriptional regulator with XRE-family HTH domain